MPSADPTAIARELFDAYRRGDQAAMVALTHPGVRLVPASFDAGEGHDSLRAAFTSEVEVTPHSFEALTPEHVLVGGRLRVFRQGLRDSPAWWLLAFRDGLWVSGKTYDTEADARAAALPAAA